MALTLADVRLRVETDLEDTPLQRILTAAVKAVDRAAGATASATEVFMALGAPRITLSRPHDSITEIRERASHTTEDATTLSADDYREFGAYTLQRIASGTNGASYWGAQVEVDYVPTTDTEVRDRVALDVVQMDVEFRALDEEEAGDWKGIQRDYRARRKGLLSQVQEGRSPIT